MKMKIKKSEKMSSIFEFSISRLCYMELFMKIYAKKFDPIFLRDFWQIEAKMKIKMKKYEKWVQFLSSAYRN